MKLRTSVSLLASAIAATTAGTAWAESSEDLTSRLRVLEQQLEETRAAMGMTTSQAKDTPMIFSGNMRFGYELSFEDGDANQKQEESLGDLNFEKLVLGMGKSYANGWDLYGEIEVFNADGEEATVAKANATYTTEGGSTVVIGKTDRPFGSTASQYSFGTQEYLAATGMVNDTSDWYGVLISTPLTDATTLDIGFAPHSAGQGNADDGVGFELRNNLSARLIHEYAPGQDVRASVMVGQTLNRHVSYEYALSSDDALDAVACSATGTCTLSAISQDHRLGGDLGFEGVLVNNGIVEVTEYEYATDWESGSLWAASLAWVGNCDNCSWTLENTYYNVDLGEDSVSSAYDPDFDLVGPGDGVVGEAMVVHGHYRHVWGDGWDSWGGAITDIGTYIEGNYMYGFDVEEEAYGVLAGIDYMVMDFLHVAHEIMSFEETLGYLDDTEDEQLFYTHFRMYF
jgi:hypothetical protein